jgi:hypothetical protein
MTSSNAGNDKTGVVVTRNVGDVHSCGQRRILRSLSSIYRPIIAEESE